MDGDYKTVVKTFLHQLNDSFRMFFEHELLSKGSAFRNVSGSLYQMKDRDFPNKKVYSNPYGQWVYDASIAGASIPSGVYNNNGSFISRGSNGLIIDFERGRAISNVGIPSVTASYAVKDFNIYTTSKGDAELIYAAKQNFRQEYDLPITGLPSDTVYGPSIFIKRDSIQNEPFAFGGQDNSIAHFRCVVMTRSEYDLDAVGSIFTDAVQKNFLLLNNPPLNRYGDVISGNSYNYLNDVAANYDSSKLVYISEVDYYRFAATTESTLGNEFKVGFIEFTTEMARYARL